MGIIKKFKNALFALLICVVGFFLFGGRFNAAPRIEETRNAYGEQVIVAVFENAKDFESFFSKIEELQRDFEYKKSRFLNVRRISFYNFLISEFSELFYKSFYRFCRGNSEELIKRMCDILAEIVMGVPEPVKGAGKDMIALNYADVEKNFREIIVERFRNAAEIMHSGRGVLPVKMIFGP